MIPRFLILFVALSLTATLARAGDAGRETVTVHTGKALQQALAKARPWTTILLAPGGYGGGEAWHGIHGAAGAPIIIAAEDPNNRPSFQGGGDVLKLSSCSYLELRGITFVAVKDNGLNIDDGGNARGRSHDIVLSEITVRGAAHAGNHDGIKLSGVDKFRLENCRVEGWGAGGSAVDMVGCHDGVLDGCTFHQTLAKGINGIEAKGMSSNVVVRRCLFESSGDRAIQLGGVTGGVYFRPAAPDHDAYEAKDCVVEGCTIIGSEAAIAFTGIDGAVVRFNTIYMPTKWVLRILQESREPKFVPCRNGEFTDNLIVFPKSIQTTVNVGGGTQPESFKFARNFWYCSDEPGKSTPKLPAPEESGVIGKDPLLADPQHGDLSVKDASPAQKVGAHAMPATP